MERGLSQFKNFFWKIAKAKLCSGINFQYSDFYMSILGLFEFEPESQSESESGDI